MLTLFDYLSAHLQTSKKSRTRHNGILINYDRFNNQKGKVFKTQSSKSCNVFPKMFVSDCIYKYTLPYVPS